MWGKAVAGLLYAHNGRSPAQFPGKRFLPEVFESVEGCHQNGGTMIDPKWKEECAVQSLDWLLEEHQRLSILLREAEQKRDYVATLIMEKRQ